MTVATQTKDVATQRKTLPQLLQDPGSTKRFEEMLGKDARSFQQNILTVYNGNTSLQQCDPESILAACAISASINLSILPSLGQSCVVPYKDGDRMVATWQIMTLGLVQLAQRSKRYAKINLARVYDGQLVNFDEFKGTVVLDAGKKKSDRIAGYYFYFRLNDGYEQEAYWPAKKCIEHGLRFSKSFQKGGGKWAEDPNFEKAGSVKKWLDGKEHFLTEGSGADAMSAKTIVKNTLTKWGPLETRIQEIVAMDQAEITPHGKPNYIDTTTVEGDAAGGKTYTAPPTPSGKAPTAAEKLTWARDAAKKQGVSHETFDAWVAAQPGDEEAKAEAATVAWKRVASKQAKAVDVFKVEKAAGEEKTAEQVATIKVASVSATEFNGDPECWVIRDNQDPPVKYFGDSAEVNEAAKMAKKEDADLAVKWIEKASGKTTVRWITKLA